MLFTQPIFFLFFAFVFALYWSLRNLSARKALLLIASYAFYAAWDWRFLGLILLSTLVDFLVALKIEESTSHKRKKRFLLISLIVNLGMLALFKYFNFFIEGATDLLTAFGAQINQTTLNIVLPVGISFYTFQTLSYSIDVYRGKIKAEKSLLDIAVFVGFFPQLVAGPIVRAADFLPQLHITQNWKNVAVKSCLLLFAVGFFKKACVSDNLAFYVDLIFSNPEGYVPQALLLGSFLYAIQIYCDFSGYTDMAIAVAGLLGFHLPKNFDAPYLARNVVDFWRRWHISLSTWLRDYLYISLGGNRHGEIKRYRNLMLTMLLGGLWHGAAWTFVFWGFLHGVGLCINHLLKQFSSVRLPKYPAIALTFVFVLAAWIYFRAPDFETASTLLVSIFSWSSEGQNTLPQTVLVAAMVCALIHIVWQKWRMESHLNSLSAAKFSIVLGFLWMVNFALQASGYAPFIYFQF